MSHGREPAAADATAHPVVPSVIATSRGPVEYARSGAGHPLVVLHGSPGGVDAAQLMARFLPRDRFAPILLSRPGYLGTPLGDNRTVDQQADVVVALLDALGVERAGVLAWSGGAPCGYRLAVRHPGRVTGLVTVAGVSRSYHVRPPGPSDRLMFGTSAGQWLLRVLAAHRPADVVRGTLADESTLTGKDLQDRVAEVMADPAKLDFVLGLGPTASTTRERRTGYDNDLAEFAALDTLDLGRITVPTLVVHGTADSDVTPEDGRSAAAAIPGARLLELVGGSHLALWTHPDADDAQREVIRFLSPADR